MIKTFKKYIPIADIAQDIPSQFLADPPTLSKHFKNVEPDF